MKKILFAAAAWAALPAIAAWAQVQPATTSPEPAKPPLEELRLKLNEDGSHYLKLTFLNQVWIRYNDSNPGTTVLTDATPETFDIGLRRTRIQFYGQLTDHVSFYSQFGQNNFNYLAGQNATNSGNRKFQVFFHDFLGEYNVWKDNDRLKLGGGLTIANGLSRFSQPSIGSIMTLDVPIFAQATVDQTDEFSRKLSLYARGQLGKFDYRLVLSDPFPVTSNGSPAPAIGPAATYAQNSHHKQYQGFFMWNFFDKEAHTTPYMTGTYLGKKKVLNLEAGFITQKNAMWTSPDGGATTNYEDLTLWSAALFYDAPLNTDKGTALSAYAGYFDMDYGTDYLRYNGSMNPANGLVTGSTVPGASQGNAFPMFGTGQVIYAQIGYLLKKDLLGEGNGTLMPYASLMSADYDRLSDRMDVWDVGVNWLIKGHTSKISLNYQSRPIYRIGAGNEYVKSSTRGQILLQYQIYF
ncbi:hypothetical protein [Dawidia soli]|uniref:Porin n=1 Tax=Dawidia soli TaxID=2782352 RepID=A0AAP2DE94_9BACT|nr:hypothetical protein [Dawidia soli]MBT1689687.1 hypothetical protein [Dawidia soli]